MAFGKESDSESESDSVEEVQIKRFLNKDFGASIKQAKGQLASHKGVKSQQGHYHILKLEKNKKLYDGKHWNVDVGRQFERSTRRLTTQTITKAVGEEQSRQVSDAKQRRTRARKSLTPLVAEFKGILRFSEKMQTVNNVSQQKRAAAIKEEIQQELVRKKNRERIANEIEQERREQIRLLRAMAPNAKRSVSKEEMLKSMAETNNRRSMINRDLEEASSRLKDSEEAMTNKYHLAMGEMLDESLIKVVQTFDRSKTRALCEEEKIRKIREQNKKQNSKDKTKIKDTRLYDGVMNDLKRLSQLVKLEESATESTQKTKIKELKTECQEELMRKISRKWAEQVTATERVRRIQEIEMNLNRMDDAKEDMKNMMSRIQRQMIIERFGGKWITQTPVNMHRQRACGESAGESAMRKDQSEQDRKLRSIRMKCRRQSCVVRREDD